MRRTSSSRPPAQALIWFTLAIPLFVTMAGLAVDGGVLLDARRDLQSMADGAARAGATRVDLNRLRSSGGADVVLDADLANRAVRTYVDRSATTGTHGWQSAPDVHVDVAARGVHVTLRAQLRTAFLRIVNIDTVLVAADANADVQFGIRNGAGG